VSSGKETPSAEFPMRWVLSPDGSRVAAVEENRLGIYELASGRLLTQMQHMPQRSRITTLAWSPDGHWLAGGTGTVNIGYPDDVEIRVWETDSGRLIGRESSYGSEWTANLSWSPDGTLLAYSSESVNIAVHEVPSWHHRATWRSDTGTTRTLAFSPDGRFIACACFNAFETGCSAIYLWEVATGEICFIYRDHEARERNTPAINWPLGAIRSSVNQITWALDGKRVASVSSFRKQEKDDVITIRDIHIWQAVEEAT
jgi:WD40 repeat protein